MRKNIIIIVTIVVALILGRFIISNFNKIKTENLKLVYKKLSFFRDFTIKI